MTRRITTDELEPVPGNIIERGGHRGIVVSWKSKYCWRVHWLAFGIAPTGKSDPFDNTIYIVERVNGRPAEIPLDMGAFV